MFDRDEHAALTQVRIVQQFIGVEYRPRGHAGFAQFGHGFHLGACFHPRFDQRIDILWIGRHGLLGGLPAGRLIAPLRRRTGPKIMHPRTGRPRIAAELLHELPLVAGIIRLRGGDEPLEAAGRLVLPFEVVKKLDKLGMRSSDTAQIFLDEVKVPVGNLIGQEGMGFVYQMQQFQEERLWGAISAVVGMGRLIDLTAEYTRERKVFGRPLLDNQVIHFKLAELSTEVELVRSLCYRACEEYLDGTDVTMLASMAKLKAGRMVRLVTDGCLQYWGGAGYLWDNPVARSFRDSRLASIGGGADEVMLQIISKHMGTLPRPETR